MIELTPDQMLAIGQTAGPPTLIDPTTQRAYVLVDQTEYRRLTEDYDDGPFTEEERDLLRAEVIAMIDDDLDYEDEP